MKVVVAGGAGFIGSNLCIALKGAGHEVLVVDDCSNGTNAVEIAGVADKFVCDDVCCESDEIRNLFEGAEVVFNLVGRTSHAGSMSFPLEDAHDNLMAPLSVLEISRVVCPDAHVIYAGTRGQYGRIMWTPVYEDHPIRPVDVNGINKHAAEQHHMLYARYHGMKTSSLRLTNIFGHRHSMRPSEGVLNLFIRRAMEHQPLNVTVRGGQRDILHVDECVEALMSTMLRSPCFGEVFNVGGRPVSLLGFARAVALVVNGHMGNIVEVDPPEERAGLEIGDFEADCSKIREATGWRPQEKPLTQFIRETVEWYEQRGMP
jgi:UDP-glucose 4-epimerase